MRVMDNRHSDGEDDHVGKGFKGFQRSPDTKLKEKERQHHQEREDTYYHGLSTR